MEMVWAGSCGLVVSCAMIRISPHWRVNVANSTDHIHLDWDKRSSPEDQLSRMVKRDQRHGLTEEDARHRLSSQLPLRKKLPYADVVLDNSSAVSGSEINGSSDSGDQRKTSEALDAQVADLVRSWRGSYGGFFGTLWWLAQWLCPPFGLLTAALCVMSRRKAVDTRLREAEESDRQADERRSLGSQ